MNLQTFSCFRTALIPTAGAVVVSAFVVTVSAQDAQGPSKGLPRDWSHRHVVCVNPYTFQDAVQNGTLAESIKKASDPRLFCSSNQSNCRAEAGPKPPLPV